MEFFNSFLMLFVNTDILTAALLVVGLCCVIAEIYQPGFTSLGICGGVFLVASVILRITGRGESEDAFGILFMLVAIIAVVVLVSFLMMIRITRYRWVRHMPDVSSESTEETDKRHNKLCGLDGVSLTTLRPVGQAQICGAEYTVFAEGFFINRGEKIKVVRAEQGNIIVRKM